MKFAVRSLAALGCAAVLSFSAPAQAAPTQYELDKPHTQIMFFVKHMGVSFSHGEFTDYSGVFTYDPENPAAGGAEVTINTASVEMNHEKWNAHLKNEDFFDVEKFPEMTFKSTGVEVTGEDTAQLTGDLTLLGVTKPVTLDVTFIDTGVHPYNKKNIIGFTATGTLNRSEFGMDYGIPNVGDEVEIRIEVEGHEKAAAAGE